jgi:hypothetical protein
MLHGDQAGRIQVDVDDVGIIIAGNHQVAHAIDAGGDAQNAPVLQGRREQSLERRSVGRIYGNYSDTSVRAGVDMYRVALVALVDRVRHFRFSPAPSHPPAQ